jgi:hypothetical protein
LSRGIEKNNMEYLSGSKLELGDSRIWLVHSVYFAQ